MLEYHAREKLPKLIVKHQKGINLSQAYADLKSLTECMAIIFATQDIQQLKIHGQLLKQAIDVNIETKSFEQTCTQTSEVNEINQPIIKALSDIHKLSKNEEIGKAVREHAQAFTWITDLESWCMKAMCDGLKLKHRLALQQKEDRKKAKRLLRDTSSFFHKHYQTQKRDTIVSFDNTPKELQKPQT